MDGTLSQSKVELRPVGWADDKLSAFFDAIRQQQFATFANFQWAYDILREIDDCLLMAASNLNQPQDVLGAVLLIRSHSAYRAACATVTATQLPESFVLQRSALEYAGYALHISKTTGLGEVWLRRHDDAAALSRAKKAFRAANVEKTIVATDAKLGEIYKQLYQSTIDFGGHPNELAVSSSLIKYKETLFGIYLHANEQAIVHCIKYVALTGLTCLHIFHNIFETRFRLLGLKDRIFALRAFEQQFIEWQRSWEASSTRSPDPGKS